MFLSIDVRIALAWVLVAMASTNRASEPAPDRSILHVSENVCTGGTPNTTASFESLKEAGVKTIISVDAARPDVDAAARSGLQTIHLPIGYDGIDDQRVLQLAKAVRETSGKVYIHCHHGKHRGPTAAAIACIATGQIDQQQAVQVLRRAGTSEWYAGLYQAVENADHLPPETLDGFEYPFQTYEPVSSLANRMLTLDSAWEELKQADAAEFPSAKLLVVEHYQELIRANQTGADFGSQNREAAMGFLQQGHRSASRMQFGMQRSLQAVQNNCLVCHRRFRN